MKIPAPHASFPHGDTIPFAVTLLTNEHGQPWQRGRDEGAGFYLYGEITRAGSPSETWGLGFTPVTGAAGVYLAEWRSPRSQHARALYRYEITLSRAPSGGNSARHYYTVLRGSLTLT